MPATAGRNGTAKAPDYVPRILRTKGFTEDGVAQTVPHLAGHGFTQVGAVDFELSCSFSFEESSDGYLSPREW
jgi:hypothetical protein